jgi:hypothetical protein
MRGPETAGGLAGCPPADPSLRKNRTHVKVCRFSVSLVPLTRASRDICRTTSTAISRDAAADSISVTMMLSRNQSAKATTG